MAEEYKYLFGPVPSRRLGRSLGVDIIPLKTCTQNCIYCQLGRDALQMVWRDHYVHIDDVIAEIKKKVHNSLEADYITISGSGEPTLSLDLGYLIGEIKKLTDTPVAVITNGTMLWHHEVRNDCAKADLVVPSLDAPNKEVFQIINKPHEDIKFDLYVQGLIDFRKEYKGKYWLEVFLVDGINTSDEQIAQFMEIIEKIDPDKIQLNTAVRPTVDISAKPIPQEKMAQIAKKFGAKAEVIVSFDKLPAFSTGNNETKSLIIATVSRRPCSQQDLVNGLGLNANILAKVLPELLQEGKIVSESRNNTIFYRQK